MPKLFLKKEECCGCSACMNVCSKNAIHMETDEKGYLYPAINENECINCGLCEKVCPLRDDLTEIGFEQTAYGVKNKDQNERKRSSSGSVFIEVAKWILNQGGVVYGVELDSDFNVKFGSAETLEDVRKFQGSKYVQSEKNDVFRKIRKDLNAEKMVLFTGTPCEVAGLKHFLRKDYDNLYTLDLICHGVPSWKSLQIYVEEKEKRYSSYIKELRFRDKSYGWRNQELFMKLNNGKVYHAPIWEDTFYRLFTNNYILRDSCYTCKYANMNRQGDITIGDFWNIKNVNKEFEDNLGVSSIIINSEKGKYLFTLIRDKFDCIKCSLADITQTNLYSPSLKPEKYKAFQTDCFENGFEYCLKKYGSMTIFEKIRRKLSPIKQKILGR